MPDGMEPGLSVAHVMQVPTGGTLPTTVGAGKIYEQICAYRDTLGNEFGYWEPAPLLERLAREGGRFADF